MPTEFVQHLRSMLERSPRSVGWDRGIHLQAQSRFLGAIAMIGASACTIDASEHKSPRDVGSTEQALQAGESEQSSSAEPRSPPPVADPNAPRPSPAPIPGLTPELMNAFALASGLSDTADYDYEIALHGLRANAREHSQRLREAIGQLPAEAHPTRQIMISMLGRVGETADDADLVEQYVLSPIGPRGLEGESTADAEARRVTAWTAVFSLARMRERAEDASSDAIERVLRQASSKVARTLFLELEIISGIKSKTYRDILQQRGISTTYTVPSGVMPLEVDPLPSAATIPPPATN